VLLDGDIVNIDITAYIGGVHGDTSATFGVGELDDESIQLIDRTRESLNRAIRAVAPGREIKTSSAGSSRSTRSGSGTGST